MRHFRIIHRILVDETIQRFHEIAVFRQRKGEVLRDFHGVDIGHSESPRMLGGDMMAANVAGAEGVDAVSKQVIDRSFLKVEVHDLGAIQFASLDVEIGGGAACHGDGPASKVPEGPQGSALLGPDHQRSLDGVVRNAPGETGSMALRKRGEAGGGEIRLPLKGALPDAVELKEFHLKIETAHPGESAEKFDVLAPGRAVIIPSDWGEGGVSSNGEGAREDGHKSDLM